VRQAAQVTFIVKDSGVGIAPNEQQAIFLPFHQVVNNQQKTEGTGLGLSISQHLVQMMGSHLEIESTLGQGSSFSFTLTLPETQARIGYKKERRSSIVGFEGKPYKILVVDDKRANRNMLIELLSTLGFQVLEAQDGQAALKKVYQHTPDVVITDLVMPLLDGFELIRRLRCSKQFSKTIIFVVSASFFEYNQLKHLKCDAFIEKPIDIQILLDKLQILLPIKWNYQDDDQNLVSQSLEREVLGLNTGPSSEQAAILLDFIMMGNLHKLTETVAQLTQQNAQLTAFAKEVSYLANHYELHKLESLIRRYV
jgi:CheY-like chemotaxis protein